MRCLLWGKRWFSQVNDEQRGPVSETELRGLLQQQILDPRTMVWSKLLGEWLPAQQAGMTCRPEEVVRDRTTPLRPVAPEL